MTTSVLTLLAIAFGTFASEDLACISTGLLIQRGQIGLTAGIVACTAGIFVGDVGLWALGRFFGRAALAWPWAARRLGGTRRRTPADGSIATRLARSSAAGFFQERGSPCT